MDGYISNKKHIFCGWSRKTLHVKGHATQDLKARLKIVGISKRNSTSKIEKRSTSSPLILGRSFLKIVRAIDIGKGESSSTSMA
jgi:hypothetical protein